MSWYIYFEIRLICLLILTLSTFSIQVPSGSLSLRFLMLISIREESNLAVRTGVGEANLYSFQFSSFGSALLGVKIHCD